MCRKKFFGRPFSRKEAANKSPKTESYFKIPAVNWPFLSSTNVKLLSLNLSVD